MNNGNSKQRTNSETHTNNDKGGNSEVSAKLELNKRINWTMIRDQLKDSQDLYMTVNEERH